MSTLYEIRNEFVQLLEMAGDESIDAEVINDTLEGVTLEFEDKADGYAAVIRSLEGEASLIKGEIERLSDRKRVVENNIKAIKNSLEEAMIAVDKRKFKTPLFSFNIQKNPPTVRIINQEDIPKEFWKQQAPVLDKKSLVAFIKEKGDTDYAELSQSESLRIR